MTIFDSYYFFDLFGTVWFTIMGGNDFYFLCLPAVLLLVFYFESWVVLICCSSVSIFSQFFSPSVTDFFLV